LKRQPNVLGKYGRLSINDADRRKGSLLMNATASYERNPPNSIHHSKIGYAITI